MNIEDFRYMYRGKAIKTATSHDKSLAKPFYREKNDTNHGILLLHGFSSTPAVFRLLLPALSGYDVIACPLLAGHGQSIEVFAKSTREQWLESAAKNCEELIAKCNKVDVLGLSLGGIIAAHLSQKFKLNHLYLLAPALYIRANIKLTLFLTKLLNTLGFKNIRNRAGNILEEQNAELTYRMLPVPIIIEILSLINDFKFTKPNCATDLFLGRFDEVVNSDKVAQLFESCPNVKTHWLENSAHILPLDGDIEKICKVIQENL